MCIMAVKYISKEHGSTEKNHQYRTWQYREESPVATDKRYFNAVWTTNCHHW